MTAQKKQRNIKAPAQRKTTLKWASNGELSTIDMTRMLDQLTNPELTECNLACNAEVKKSKKEEP